jgi:2-aminobenzoate-CoA ligase
MTVDSTLVCGKSKPVNAFMLDPSAYADSFARDHLPPFDLWPAIDGEALAALGYPQRVNAAVELLDGAVARGLGGRPCLRTVDATWSYAELLEKANRIAAVLVKDFGLIPGNRVLLRSANNSMLAACWFAVLKAGGIAVTTMPLLRARELTQVINKAKVQIALCDARLGDELESARAACPTLGRIGYFNSTEADGVEARMRAASSGFDNVIPSHDDVALIAFTSGTTGAPKATMHFHRDALAICDCYPEAVLRSTPDDIFAGSPPLGFTYGLGALLLFPMRRGASSLMLERCTPEILLQAAQDFRVTTMMTGPTLYRTMTPLLPRFDIAGLKTCCSAGEHLPIAVFDEWLKRTGIRILDAMGSTEMLHNFIGIPRGDIRAGSTGLALPGHKVIVVDDAMNPVPPNTIGRLAVKGPTGCRYLDDPERQKAYVKNGWNVTGDAFHQDEDGFFWYHARTDDMIVSSGYNISGAEIEEVLLCHPDVRECAVVGIPDAARGQIVKAYIVPNEKSVAGADLQAALQTFVKNAVAPYKYPRAIEFVAELPRTGTGKIQRSALRQSAEPISDSAPG